MPTYDRIHLKSCLSRAVISAVENLRDDASISHLTFHRVIDGGTNQGYSLYAAAYEYLELGMVNCTCEAPVSRNPEAASTSSSRPFRVGDPDPTPDEGPWCDHWACTRPPNHDDDLSTTDHIAGGGGKIMHIYPNEETASTSRTPRYDWLGWQEETENDNPDDRPGVWYLTITEDGEEYAVIMHRTLDGKHPLNGPLALSKVRKAQRIVDALNGKG